ncbi:MAG: hypothetical protein II574_03145 [Ruminococcus sp.]|nr:hypothetical protein [Ruminococcus sp.]
MYKEGYSIDQISEHMQMNKGAARALLEKYMPDYESYQQPTVTTPIESGGGVMSKIGNPFKKKKKNEAPAAAAPAAATAINLNYDENGFIDKHTESIAKMIRRGDSDKKIAEFFNCTVSDVRAVKAAVDQMALNPKPVQEAPAPAAEQTAEEEFNPFMTDKIKRDNNLSKLAEEKAAEREQVSGYDPYGPGAVADPYAVPYDQAPAAETAETAEAAAMQELSEVPTDLPVLEDLDAAPAAEDTFSIDEFITEKPTTDENGEYIPDIKFEDDYGEEMPSISTDNLVFDEPAAPAQTSYTEYTEAIDEIRFDMDAIDSTAAPAATEEEQISFELKESDAEMTPMEKMKMFAKQQIDENNKKLDSLNAEKDRTANELAHDEAELAATRTNIEQCESQISELNIQLSEINAKLTDLSSKLSEYQIEENKLLDATVSRRAANQELENSIAEILKENADYETYLN